MQLETRFNSQIETQSLEIDERIKRLEQLFKIPELVKAPNELASFIKSIYDKNVFLEENYTPKL